MRFLKATLTLLTLTLILGGCGDSEVKKTTQEIGQEKVEKANKEIQRKLQESKESQETVAIDETTEVETQKAPQVESSQSEEDLSSEEKNATIESVTETKDSTLCPKCGEINKAGHYKKHQEPQEISWEEFQSDIENQSNATVWTTMLKYCTEVPNTNEHGEGLTQDMQDCASGHRVVYGSHQDGGSIACYDCKKCQYFMNEGTFEMYQNNRQ